MNTTGETYTPSGTGPVYVLTQPAVTFSSLAQPSRAVRVQALSASTQPAKALKAFQRRKPVGASTEFYEPSDALYSKTEAIFWTAKGEVFEDGMESAFSRKLNYFVKKYSEDALEAITCLIVYEKVDSEIAGEALRWLGRVDHTESYEYRRWLLERSLSLSSTRVRDGAILGLASMDDKHAIPYLRIAIEKEQFSELKADMELVLEQLEI
jgi:hypothetical protein